MPRTPRGALPNAAGAVLGGASACVPGAWTTAESPLAIGDAVAPMPRCGGVDVLDGARRGERAGGHRDGQTPGADADRAQTDRTGRVAGGHPAPACGRPG